MITIYAAVAFVILQLVDIVSQPLHFPEWTQGFIIVLLCIGFIIAILLSWIYDLTPAGVKKTKPADTIKHNGLTSHPSPTGWKIATLISVLVIVALMTFNFIIRRSLNADISKFEKSIAVLPFRNDSRDSTNQYFINGIMEMITTNLQMVKVLRVVSRTSVEQYRNNKTKSISEIAKELDVNYIIEGSGQKYGNSFSVTTQLIKAKGKETHLWAKTYEQEIQEVNDYIRIESQIAQAVASELKATITPEEKQMIERTPTSSLTAYDYFKRGRDEHWRYHFDREKNSKLLENAKDHYLKALEYDSTFAQAYTGLAWVYWDKYYWKTLFTEHFLDSVLILANKALSFDNQLSEAYLFRGQYYSQIRKSEEAIKEFDKAIQFNPNDWIAYFWKGVLYRDFDFVKSIENYQKAILLNRDSQLPDLLRGIAFVYNQAGFRDKAEYSNNEAIKLDGDSLGFYGYLSFSEETHGNFTRALYLYKRIYALDTTNIQVLWNIGNVYVFLERYDEALEWFKKFIKHSEYIGYVSIIGYNRIGLAYWKKGHKEEAMYYFDKFLNNLTMVNELGRSVQGPFENASDLASMYAFLGEKKEKVYEKLRLAGKSPIWNLYGVMYVNNDPLIESYRDDPVFQQFVRDVESKYKAEHERVRKWLDENGQL
jgi:TolB-like protein/Tfp pilus assembly protein PilF